MTNQAILTKVPGTITLPSAEVDQDYDCELTTSDISGNTYMTISSSNKSINGVKIENVSGVWHFKGRPTESTEGGSTTFTILVRDVTDRTNFFEVVATFTIREKKSLNASLPPCMKDMQYTHTLMTGDSLEKGTSLRIKTEDASNVPAGLRLDKGVLVGAPTADVSAEKVFEFIVELFNSNTKKVEATYSLSITQLKKLTVKVTEPPRVFINYTYKFSLDINGGSGRYTIKNVSDIDKQVKVDMPGITFNGVNKSFSGKLTSAIKNNQISLTIEIQDSAHGEFKIKEPLVFISEAVHDITKVIPSRAELPPIDPGKGYNATFKATGGYGTLHYKLNPAIAGMSINELTGIITGVPREHLDEDEVKLTVVVTDTPPTGDLQKTETFKDLHAKIIHQVAAPLIEAAVDSNAKSTELYLALYFPRHGRDITDIKLIEPKTGKDAISITGMYGVIAIKEDDLFTLTYTPNAHGGEGVDTVHYKVSNGVYHDSNVIRFDVLHKLQAANKEKSAQHGEVVTVNLSNDAIGGPFDSALTHSEFTSANSFCTVTNENGKIILSYTIPRKNEFSGNQLVIKYILVKRIHTSQLAKVTIKIT
ncbi:hypothetical protein [Serratia liquefaciens]|uniref:hypothetical protein n=1 Tax=Serratia liquefaciens TaxID=614 RepID=UPI003906378B